MLPGIAVAFLVAGASSVAMSIGAVAAGLAVAAAATFAARRGGEQEDAGFAAFFTIALALGAAILSAGGASADLGHILFGSALAVDRAALLTIAGAASAALIVLTLVWPALVLDAADPGFLASVSRAGPWAHAAFMAAMVLALAGTFQAVGTLMSVGLLVLPAAAARLWTRRLDRMIALAVAIGATAVFSGLMASYHLGAPTGACIVLFAGGVYGASLILNAGRRAHAA
jgi:zinc/manganese transport system permease protein